MYLPDKTKMYGKRPLWQWIFIYAVAGLIVYGAIYYFAFSKKGGYQYSPQEQETQQYAPSPY